MQNSNKNVLEWAQEEFTGDRSLRVGTSGVLAGTIVFGILYAVTWVFVEDKVGEQFSGLVPTWKGVSWYVSNAHFVGLSSSGDFGPFAGDGTTNLLALSVQFSTDVLFVLPPLLLVVAGAAVGYLVASQASHRDRLLVGLSVAIAYGGLLFIGALVSGHHIEGLVFGTKGVSETVSIPLENILVAGVLYPSLFATVGAYAGSELN